MRADIIKFLELVAPRVGTSVLFIFVIIDEHQFRLCLISEVHLLYLGLRLLCTNIASEYCRVPIGTLYLHELGSD